MVDQDDKDIIEDLARQIDGDKGQNSISSLDTPTQKDKAHLNPFPPPRAPIPNSEQKSQNGIHNSIPVPPRKEASLPDNIKTQVPPKSHISPQSTIRTMNDDLDSLSRYSTDKSRAVPRPPASSDKTNSRTLTKPEPNKENHKVITSISFLKNKKVAIIIGITIITVATMLGFLYMRSTEPAVIIPTPRPSISPTPVLPSITLDDIFSGAEVSLSIDTSDLIGSFVSGVNSFSGFIDGGVGEPEFSGFRKIIANEDICLINLLDIPPYVIDLLGDDCLTLIYRQEDIYGQNGERDRNAQLENRIIFISEVTDPIIISDRMTLWENIMPGDFKNVFELDLEKQNNPVFMSSIYNNVFVRFINFTYPDRSIDYTLVKASNDIDYIVISNSRQSMFETIDILK